MKTSDLGVVVKTNGIAINDYLGSVSLFCSVRMTFGGSLLDMTGMNLTLNN